MLYGNLAPNGCIVKNVEYQGLAAHASTPSGAINALYSANLGLSAVNALRETFDDQEHIRVHPIVTCGGTVVNAIPSCVRLESYVRGASMAGIQAVNQRVNRALAASAAALGAKVRLRDCPGYFPLHNDPNLIRLAGKAFAEVVGAGQVATDDEWGYGCTDMGDLSAVMPVLHPYAHGCAGTGHGSDYRIDDPVAACVVSAQAQLLLLCRLLENDAAQARRVAAEAKPLFAAKADFFDCIDRLFYDRQPVRYEEDGSIRLEL